MVPILQHLFSRCAMVYLATHPLVMVLPFPRKGVNLGEINASTAPFFFTSSLVPNPLNGAAHTFVMDLPWSKSLSGKNLRNTPRSRFPWWFYVQPRRQWRLTTPGFYNSPFVCQNLTQILHFQESLLSSGSPMCALPKAMPGARSPSKPSTLCLPQFFSAHRAYRQLHFLSSSPYPSQPLLQKPLATSEATTWQNSSPQLRQNPATQPEVTPAIKSPGPNMGGNPSTQPQSIPTRRPEETDTKWQNMYPTKANSEIGA